MKRLFGILTAAFLACTAFCAPVFAQGGSAGTYARVVDQADLLTEAEEASLNARLDEISERQQVDVTVVTVPEIQSGFTVESYADGIYELCDYGFGAEHDGVMFMVSMAERDWHIVTEGYGITAFTDYGIEYIGDQMKSDLGAGNYAAAFETYASYADSFITQAKDGNPFDVPKKPFPLHIAAIVSALMAFIGSGAHVGGLQRELKSVEKQRTANSYTREGSMQLTTQRDIFLYNKIDRVKKEKKSSGGSSTHTSSSGRTHGGGGGKF